MQSVKVKARIHSLDGEMDEVTVVEKKAKFEGIGKHCTKVVFMTTTLSLTFSVYFLSSP